MKGMDDTARHSITLFMMNQRMYIAADALRVSPLFVVAPFSPVMQMGMFPADSGGK